MPHLCNIDLSQNDSIPFFFVAGFASVEINRYMERSIEDPPGTLTRYTGLS